MPNLTDTLATIIFSVYASTGLLGIIIAMAIESCCIPLPSEVVMPLAGVVLAQGKLLPGMNPVVGVILIGLSGAIGCLIGSIAAYYIGYKGGRPLLMKYGRYVLISQHDLDKADHYFQRWGSATAFFSRLLPGVRTYISLPAGMAEMPFVRFCVYSFLGSFPWCLLLAYAGYRLGQNWNQLHPIFQSLDIVIVVAGVALIALYIWRHVHNDRKARAEHAARAAAAAAVSTPQVPAQNWNQPAQPQQQWNQVPQNQFQPSQQPPQSPQWGQQPSQPQWGQQTPQQPPQRGQQPQQPQTPWPPVGR